MTKENKKHLIELLDALYVEKSKSCDFDCYNCEYGILEDYYSGHSCSIEYVSDLVGYMPYLVGEEE